MWLITTIGFFSAVQKPGTDFLTVRARSAGDLDQLRAKYLPSLSPTTMGGGTDYPARATISHAAFAEGIGKAIRDIHYPNFKEAAAASAGHERARAYGDVWRALLAIEEEASGSKPATSPAASPAEKPAASPARARKAKELKAAFGGVVFDAEGRVLLREPASHMGGYSWTFPKGRPAGTEPPEDTAVRGVLQETGVEARIVEKIPGLYEGFETQIAFFLMERVRDKQRPDRSQTMSVRWATPDEARTLIAETTYLPGKIRDAAVLAAALKARSLRQLALLPPEQLLDLATPGCTCQAEVGDKGAKGGKGAKGKPRCRGTCPWALAVEALAARGIVT